MVHEFDVTDQDLELTPESKGEPWGEIIRDYEPKPDTHWRFGKPNYARVNKAYFKGRSKKHPAGSLEEVVTKLVKNWEVESHHIYDIRDWQTMDTSKFEASLNGGCPINAQVMADIGPYNMLVGDTEGYKASANTFESANENFSNTFPDGFAWECLQVYSPPPEVAFNWRHFGVFNGEFTDDKGEVHAGNGKLIEVFGACIAKVNADLVIESLKVYYDPNTQIQPLLTNKYKKEKPMCPFAPRCYDNMSDDEDEDEGIDQED